MNTDPLRPGKETSEYRVTMFSQVLAFLLASFGIFTYEDSEWLVPALSVVGGSFISIYSAIVYIWSRKSLKSQAIKTEQEKINGIEISQRG